jgi:hypothetical protein
MKKLLPLIIVIFAFSTFGQTPDLATGTYAESGRLISLTNLSGLSDCESSNVVGKISKVKLRAGLVSFRVKAKGEKKSVDFRLDRLSTRERTVVFLDLVKGAVTVRISGYSCGLTGIISAFSIDRVWGIDTKK